MTPERKEKFSRVYGKVVELLKRNSEGPMEAYMLLCFIQQAFEKSYGIRGGVIVDNKEGV
jgi:hypothetical protein